MPSPQAMLIAMVIGAAVYGGSQVVHLSKKVGHEIVQIFHRPYVPKVK